MLSIDVQYSGYKQNLGVYPESLTAWHGKVQTSHAGATTLTTAFVRRHYQGAKSRSLATDQAMGTQFRLMPLFEHRGNVISFGATRNGLAGT